MDHICFHVVVSSNEAASRLLANSILLCDIKDYHSMRAEKNHSKTAQREELLRTERTINSNLYLMSKRTEHERKEAKANQSLISQWGPSAPMPMYGEQSSWHAVGKIGHFATQEPFVTSDRRCTPLCLVWIKITAFCERWNPNNKIESNAMFCINKNHP